MGAITNKQYQTVKLMLDLQYIPTIPQADFEKTKHSADKHGNTPLHIAYKVTDFKIAELLINYGICDNEVRNIRGDRPL